jgi:hypothetical protein
LTREPSAYRARAHPRAIAGVWAWQACFALLAAWPAASLVRSVFASDPRGDAALWEPGGAALLDFLWHDTPGAVAAVDGALLVVLVAMAAGWLPLAALMAAMAGARSIRTGVARSALATFRVLPTFVRCALVVVAAQGATLGAGAFLASLVEGWTRGRLGEAPAQRLALAVGLPFVLGALALGVAHDLARSVIVVRGRGAVAGLTEGWRLYRSAPAGLSLSWAWRSIASIAAVGLAGVLAAHTGAGAAGFVVLVVVHQGVALLRVALRASWLARAMRAAAGAPQAAVTDL